MSKYLNRVADALGVSSPPPPEQRTVFVNHKRPPDTAEEFVLQKFPSNRITTSKYTAWNFLPKNLFEQFRRIANFYFLIVGVVQLTIDSPVSAWTTLLPLLFVISVTAVKQAYEDWLRHRADNEVNNRPASVIRDGELIKIRSEEIRVGDIVKVFNNQELQADLVMLSSVDPEGQCHITTANLDGETNLKIFTSLPDTALLQSVESLNGLVASIECEQPQPDLYKFIGRMNIYVEGSEPKTKPLGPENVLLRGSRLKNTPYVYGCAIYTGQETKMALNSKQKGLKISIIESSMNDCLIFCLCWLIVQSCLCTGLYYWFESRDFRTHLWYLSKDNGSVTAGDVIENILAFLVLFSYIIPISLYVTLELQKFCATMFFPWDIDMYDERTDEPAKANTSDLIEMLGQVEYLFSDKTGTLTENDMQFRHCSIDGAKYSEVEGKLQPIDTTDDGEIFISPEDQVKMQEFLTALALCHVVHVHQPKKNGAVTEVDGPVDNSSPPVLEYQASSPDEKALVEAASRNGVIFTGGTQEYMDLLVDGKQERYQLQHVLEFDSDRKRMSVIVKTPDGRNLMICKGAETAILDNCKSGNKNDAIEHLTYYAMDGLRTLCISQRYLTDEEYDEFDARLHDARTALNNREEKLADAFEYVEKDLHLLGATGVEDRLQEGVSETIEKMRQAGIKVWILTGDKQETAVNISKSCGHIQHGMSEMYLVKQESSEQCLDTLNDLKMKITEDTVPKHALCVDGMSLSFALNHHSELFRMICEACVAVLCCRMTPLQKAEVVKLMKRSDSKPITGAIGDGANDVSMIQEAHLGLGIMGKEGRQAVRCSDYAFARFKFLQKALLVHGHWYYIRVTTLVQYFFYKNFAMITPQFYFCFFNAFSQQTLYHSFYLTFYNVLFTSLPILIYGIFEKNLSPRALLNYPELYKDITRNFYLRWWQYCYWIMLGLYHSLCFYFGTMLLMADDVSLLPNNQQFGLFTFGSICMTICVIVVNFKLCYETRHWDGVWIFSMALTIVGYFALLMLYSGVFWYDFMEVFNFYWVFFKMMESPSFWLGMIIIGAIAVLPDFIYKCILYFIFPEKSSAAQKQVLRYSSIKQHNSVNEKTPFTKTYKRSRGREAIEMSSGNYRQCSSFRNPTYQNNEESINSTHK
ncbi:phospholipid-transporting ATPase IF-like isoform X5 [Ptychodera flava]|uniref:phospholipid-transporting ATPase IF-like isoform X5 n=1 Tax=Ptychodera flava TaxID=63121 RepID=UPI00396A6E61